MYLNVLRFSQNIQQNIYDLLEFSIFYEQFEIVSYRNLGKSRRLDL
jgi:hypothetical protein